MNKKQHQADVLTFIMVNGKHGARTKDIASRTGEKLETVCSSLRTLLADGLVRKEPDLMDMRRSKHYYPAPFIMFRIVKEDGVD